MSFELFTSLPSERDKFIVNKLPFFEIEETGLSKANLLQSRLFEIHTYDKYALSIISDINCSVFIGFWNLFEDNIEVKGNCLSPQNIDSL